jgi:hypothetical protein
VIVTGDFRQLAPIALADDPAQYPNAARWLTVDIFEQAGILDQEKRVIRDSRVSCLRRQYRMHPAIGKLANALAYSDNPLEHAGDPDTWVFALNKAPSPGRALVFLDTSTAGSWCSRTRPGWSRYNPYSALLNVLLARAINDGGSPGIGLITPYRAQSRLMRNLGRAFGLTGEEVEVATVHRLQGGEKSVVLVDLVDGYPYGVGKLLRGGFGSAAMRLLNVAFTRAQGKLIITGDALKLKAVLHPGESLYAAIEHLDPRRFLPAHELLETLVSDSAKAGLPGGAHVELLREDAFFPRFLSDLTTARSDVVLFTPYVREKHVKEILAELVKLSRNGVNIVLVTRSPSRFDGPPEVLSPFTREGSKIIRRHRLTERMAFIDDRAAYFGNLAILSCQGSEGFMIRLGHPQIVRPLLDITGRSLMKAGNDERREGVSSPGGNADHGESDPDD